MINEGTMLEVMKEFEWGRVLATMKALDWAHYDSVSMLKATAITLWESVDNWNINEYTSIESSGLRWSKKWEGAPLVLEFIVEQVDWIGGDDA